MPSPVLCSKAMRSSKCNLAARAVRPRDSAGRPPAATPGSLKSPSWDVEDRCRPRRRRRSAPAHQPRERRRGQCSRQSLCCRPPTYERERARTKVPFGDMAHPARAPWRRRRCGDCARRSSADALRTAIPHVVGLLSPKRPWLPLRASSRQRRGCVEFPGQLAWPPRCCGRKPN